MTAWSRSLLLLPVLAAVSEDLAASPFRGVLVPAGALAGDADASAIELNPGQLGLLDGASWALVGDHWDAATARPGRGAALLLAVPIFGSTLAGGVQWLRPTLPNQPSSYGKLHLGYGLRMGRGGGLGVAWEHLFGAGYGGLNSFTVGLGARLHRMIALGIAVRDVTRPRPAAGQPLLPRAWEGEVALRPLGNDRLELGLGARLYQGIDDPIRPRARVALRLLRGLGLFGELEQATYEIGGSSEWRGLAGLQVDLGYVTFLAAGTADQRATPTGSSVLLRGSPFRRPPLVARDYVARIAIRGLESDAAFLDLVVRLRHIAADDDVAAVLLEIDDLDIGLGRVQELRALVGAVQRRVPVFAYVSDPSTREYYLASACDRILIHPAGALGFTGLAQSVLFYKGALDKIGVNVELLRIAEYKGAMEPFVMTEQSEPVRENRNALLDDHFRRLVAEVAAGRKGLGPEQLQAAIDRAIFSPEEARNQKLVDFVVDDETLESRVGEALGRRRPFREAVSRRAFPAWVPARIAVVLVDGPIVEGPERGFPFSSAPIAFSDRIVETLERVRRDRSIRAVVLRVNSPGGSAFASDRIARAVAKVRHSGKPVVVSMGDVAASGGYYISAVADEIFASPGTTTGSIGIFGYKVDVAALMEKVGLAAETTKRGEHADLFSPYRPWTDEERLKIEGHLRHMYKLFLDTIELGRGSRGITAARADELGRGRIWTGAQAHAVKLVDRMGGLLDAIDEAARRGHVPRGPGGLPELVVLPKRTPSPLEALTKLPLVATHGRAAARLLASLLLGQGSGIEARLPYEIEIR